MWKDYLREKEREIAKLIIAGANPNLDITSTIKLGGPLEFDVQEIMFNRTEPLLNYIINIKAKDLISLLISYGANPELRDSDGKTALLVASASNNFEALSTLLKYSPNLNIQDSLGNTALILCHLLEI